MDLDLDLGPPADSAAAAADNTVRDFPHCDSTRSTIPPEMSNNYPLRN